MLGKHQKAQDTPSPPHWLLAELTYACPLQCIYCSNPLDFSQRKKELDTKCWIQLLRNARELGAVQLGLSGGGTAVKKGSNPYRERSTCIKLLYESYYLCSWT